MKKFYSFPELRELVISEDVLTDSSLDNTGADITDPGLNNPDAEDSSLTIGD